MKQKRTSWRINSLPGLALLVVVVVVLVLVLIALLDARPPVVYVPVDRQEVALAVRASTTEAVVGQTVVLHAHRWNRGRWKQVSARDLAADACRAARPPAPHEEEVADNLAWTVSPAGTHRLNTDYRTDRTRTVVFDQAGTYVLEARSTIWCGDQRVARAGPLEIRVRDRTGAFPGD